MQVEPSLGGEDGWKRWGTEAEARPSYLYHQGPCCPLVACLDISLAALVNIASQSPGSWQAHGPRPCCSPSHLCCLWADWLWATASLWAFTTPPLL